VALAAAGGKAGPPEDGAEAAAGEDNDYVFYCCIFFHLPLHSVNTPTSGRFLLLFSHWRLLLGQN
jgi:hypothetical protein